ncbi:MAG: S41 family peptidase [Candidatus Omnitrophota bacterium]
MNKLGSHAVKVAVCIIMMLSGSIHSRCAADGTRDADGELYKQIELLSDTISIVQADYVEEIEPQKLVYGALKGMLSSLDGYSQFMDPDSFREMNIETKGEFGGLGIEIGVRDGVLTVIAPMDGTPAQRAGLKSGDKIVKISGELTEGVTLIEAVKKLRGKPKTTIDLTILREGEEKLLDFTIERSIIKLNSIKMAKMLEGMIGYIKIVEFQRKTESDLEKHLSDFKKEGVLGLILDLRNNPGGLLDAADGVSDKFLDKDKVIVLLKGRIPKQNKVFKSSGKNNFTDFPMVVLVNKGSASASEIVAGAIQDNKRGIILGTTTFGKGSVQTVVPLSDGSAARITTAAYYTPSGRSITDKGIIPDVEVELIEEPEIKEKEDVFKKLKKDKPIETGDVMYDNQIRTAISLLKGMLLYKDRI